MTFEMTLGEHLPMAASTSMFYIAIYYKNERIWKYESSSQQCKHQNISAVFLTADSWCPSDHCTAENLRGFDTNLLLNNV